MTDEPLLLSELIEKLSDILEKEGDVRCFKQEEAWERFVTDNTLEVRDRSSQIPSDHNWSDSKRLVI